MELITAKEAYATYLKCSKSTFYDVILKRKKLLKRVRQGRLTKFILSEVLILAKEGW